MAAISKINDVNLSAEIRNNDQYQSEMEMKAAIYK